MKAKCDSNQLEEILHQEEYKNRRNNTVRLAEYFEQVMALKAQKYPHKLIVAALAKQGLNFTTPGTFETTLGRIAIKRKKEGKPSAPYSEKFDSPTTANESLAGQENHEETIKKKVKNKIEVTSPEKLSGIINGPLDLTKFRNNDD